MNEKDFFAYRNHLADVASEDLRYVGEKDRSYDGSWKRGGGHSAWFMIRRKLDRLISMMSQPTPPPGWPNSVAVTSENVDRLKRMAISSDIFARIDAQPGGEDGTVLAEIRDLRRYLLLVEADAVARGVVTLTVRPGTPEDGGHYAWADEAQSGAKASLVQGTRTEI